MKAIAHLGEGWFVWMDNDCAVWVRRPDGTTSLLAPAPVPSRWQRFRRGVLNLLGSAKEGAA